MSHQIDVSGDGGVLKDILREGTGATPEKHHQVTVHYVGTLVENGKKFDSSRDRNEPFKFEIGTGKVIKGWDLGVATMKIGELATFTIKSKYAYGESGAGADIPANADLKFEVELFDSEPRKRDVWSMSSDEKITAAQTAKENGNKKFAEGDIGGAMKLYEEATGYFENFDEVDDAIKEQAKPIRISCHLNFAQCHIKCQGWLPAVVNCSAALALDPTNSKALYRRAVARLGCKDLDAARQDLVAAARLDPQNVVIRRTLEECKKEIGDVKVKERAHFKGMFAKIGTIYGDKPEHQPTDETKHTGDCCDSCDDCGEEDVEMGENVEMGEEVQASE